MKVLRFSKREDSRKLHKCSYLVSLSLLLSFFLFLSVLDSLACLPLSLSPSVSCLLYRFHNKLFLAVSIFCRLHFFLQVSGISHSLVLV